MDYNSWLQSSGLSGGPEADPYNLGDYANGAVYGNSGLGKREDESVTDFLQRAYTTSQGTGEWGTQGRTLSDMNNAGFFNELPTFTRNGQTYSRTGEDLNTTLGGFDGDTIQKYVRERGGVDNLGQIKDDQYGWALPTKVYGDMTHMQDYTKRKMSGINDWLPTLFYMAATAGVGALGSGAAVAAGAGEGAAAGGGAAASGASGFGAAMPAATTGGLNLGLSGGQLATGINGAVGSMTQGGSPTNGLIGLAGNAAGSYFGGGSGIDTGDTSWGVNARDGGSMDFTDVPDNWDSSFGGNTYDYNYDYGGNGSNLDPYQIDDNMNGSRDPGTETNGMDPNYLDTLLKGGGSLLKLLGGSGGTAGGLMKLLGGAGSAGLGYLGARSQQQAYKEMQDKWLAMGQPSRDRLEASYRPGFNLAASDPAYQGAMDQSANSVLRKLSASGGNPWDSPGALMEANKYVMQNTALPQLNTYRSQNATSGQFGTNTAGTAQGASIQAGGGQYDALGAGLYNITKPQGTTLEDLARRYGMNNGTSL